MVTQTAATETADEVAFDITIVGKDTTNYQIFGNVYIND